MPLHYKPERLTLVLAIMAIAFTSRGALAAEPPTVDAKGAIHSQARPRQQQQVAKRGRAVIFRAGELPRTPNKPEDRGIAPPAELQKPTHYLDTTLPVIIQGAPHNLAMLRHLRTV